MVYWFWVGHINLKIFFSMLGTNSLAHSNWNFALKVPAPCLQLSWTWYRSLEGAKPFTGHSVASACIVGTCLWEYTMSYSWLPTVNLPVPGAESRWRIGPGEDGTESLDRWMSTKIQQLQYFNLFLYTGESAHQCPCSQLKLQFYLPWWHSSYSVIIHRNL